jgi:hypothetical protein
MSHPSRKWPALAVLAEIALAGFGLLLLSAPKPIAHVSSLGRGPAVLLPHPRPNLTSQATAIAAHLHTAGLLLLIAAVVAAIATAAWLRQTRPPGDSGITPTPA